MELMWSKREETSADATEAAIPSSKDRRTNLPERTNVTGTGECFGVRFHGEIRIECCTKNFDFSR